MSASTNPEEVQSAHQLLTRLQTTIALRPLPYQWGTHSGALDSLLESFKKARDFAEAHPGSKDFNDATSEMLNSALSPFMAKWHKRSDLGLLASRDGGDEFRADLADLQTTLVTFANRFHQIAYGANWTPLPATVVMPSAEMQSLFAPLGFGIPNLGQGINRDEAQEVAARRRTMGSGSVANQDAVGLAFSGGGIRSATFCLGVTQVLAEKDLLKDVDFLSTVSGGGYTGSFLTQQIANNGSWKAVAAPHGPDPDAIRHLRQRAKFLTARSLWEAWGMVTATVAGMLMNWTVPLLVLTILAAVTTVVGGLKQTAEFWKWAVITVAALGGGAGIAYFRFLRSRSLWAFRAGWLLAFAVAGVLAVLVGWGITVLFHEIFLHSGTNKWHDLQAARESLANSPLWKNLPVASLSLGAISAIVPVILRYIPLLKNPSVRKIVTKVALVFAGAFVPALGLIVFLLLCAIGNVTNLATLPLVETISGTEGLWILAGFLTLLAIFVLNINLTGPHRLYRNGLSKTFVERDDGKDTDFPLKDVNSGHTAPYHLINAAVNLPSSTAAGLRERRCDFFLFSKYWTGSPVVDYAPTKDWLMNGKPVDLATAMAISGAAFSSSMGLGSIPPLRALLAFLNVRLGFWIRKPKDAGLWGLMKWNHPGFFCLLREMGGFGMAEHHRWLNLSDGGHIENLAVYELLRRRCKFIVCVDGEADPGFTFHGLMTLVRHAQIDFGIRISPDLSDIRPNPESNLSRAHFHLWRIHYPNAGKGHPSGTGLLLYIKLSVTGNESELIKRYRKNNPEFPHQTTLDQFFDEEQFEAYRQLGVHVAEGLFAKCLTNISSATPTAGPALNTGIAKWFHALSTNLLEPKQP